MNKVFKIVFNAARGTRMVVNETTSSVQTGKKAAVTVAVVGALAAGSAMGAATGSIDGVDTEWTKSAAATGKTYQILSGVKGASNIPSSIIMSVNGRTDSEDRVFGFFLDNENIETKVGALTVKVTAVDSQSHVTQARAFSQFAGTTTFTDNVYLGVENGTAINGFVNAVNLYDNATVTFAGNKTELVAYNENFTAQGINYFKGTTLKFTGGDVTITAVSDYGVNGFGSADNDSVVTFDNTGNVTINAFVTDGIADSNAYGYISNDNELKVTNNVNKFSVNVIGSGMVNAGSDGTAGIGSDDGKIDIQAKELEVIVKSGQDIEGNTVTADDIGRGIWLGEGAELTVSSKTNLRVTHTTASACGLLVDSSSASFSGPTDIYASGKGESHSVKLINNAKATFSNSVNLTGDIAVDSGSILTLNAQTSLTGKATIEGTLAGNGQLLIDSEESKVSLSRDTDVTVGTTGDLTDALGGDASKVAANFTGVDQIVMQEGDVIGQTTATLAGGKVSSVTQAVNKKTEALAEQVTLAPQMITRIMMNDVRKRMGDLRSAEGTHGVWARYNGGQLAGSGMEADFNMIQVGIDTVPVADAPRFGVAFSYAQTEADATNGLATTDMDSFSLAFYGTKMYDNGMFVDVIGRMATMDTEMTVQGNKAEMDNVALSLSGELGWRFDVTDQFFFEPSVEATYTYTNADTFKMGQGTYELESVDSLVGRAGFAAGFKCPANKGDVYVRAAVVHEFMGDSTMNSMVNGRSAKPVESDGEDTYFEYAVGAQFNVNKNTYVYADVERTEGANVDEDWRANVGVRFAF